MAYLPPFGGAGNLQSVLVLLNNWGLQDLWIPFILIFALIFAILQKIKIFSKTLPAVPAQGTTPGTPERVVGDKKINGILAFTISLMLAAGHTLRYYPVEYDPFIIITTFVPQTGIALVAILLAILMVGIIPLGRGKTLLDSGIVLIFVTIALLAVLVSIIGGIWPTFAPDWLRFNPLLQAVVIVVAVMGLVVWYITRDDSRPADIRTRLRGWYE